MADRSATNRIRRWAVVIGISEYQDASLNLGYADRDAEAFYDLIRSPSGGDFPEQQIEFLVNEKATTRQITRALRTFLQKPAREDLVVIYIACHGCPDPNRPENIYLLSHDVDPSDIAGTAVPMDEIDSSLRKNLHAEKVVIIADTCHSAAIGGGVGRREVSFADSVNNFLDGIGNAKEGTALLTSCEANQTSQESEKWGGGHGVFTHFLLEGMRGGADREPRNGQVTIGELFEYVREKVKDATSHQQHPSIGNSPFDRAMPIAIPGLKKSRELSDEASREFDAGDLNSAENLWQEALEHDPNSEDAKAGLAEIAAIRKQERRLLNRRRKVLIKYQDSGELTAEQFETAMHLLDDAESLTPEEMTSHGLTIKLVDRQITIGVYTASLEALSADTSVRPPHESDRTVVRPGRKANTATTDTGSDKSASSPPEMSAADSPSGQDVPAHEPDVSDSIEDPTDRQGKVALDGLTEEQRQEELRNTIHTLFGGNTPSHNDEQLTVPLPSKPSSPRRWQMLWNPTRAIDYLLVEKALAPSKAVALTLGVMALAYLSTAALRELTLPRDVWQDFPPFPYLSLAFRQGLIATAPLLAAVVLSAFAKSAFVPTGRKTTFVALSIYAAYWMTYGLAYFLVFQILTAVSPESFSTIDLFMSLGFNVLLLSMLYIILRRALRLGALATSWIGFVGVVFAIWPYFFPLTF